MDARSAFGLLVCIFLAFWLRIEWLGWLLIGVAVLAVLGEMKAKEPAVKAVPAAEAPEKVLYPVIYEDVGAPYLYSPKVTKIKIAPIWMPWSLFEGAARGMGFIGRSAWRALCRARDKL